MDQNNSENGHATVHQVGDVLRIRGGWNRKSGRAQYGSEGTCLEIEFDVPIDLWEKGKRGELSVEAAQLQAFCKLMVDRAIDKADAEAEHRALAALEAAAQRDADRRAAAQTPAEPGAAADDFDEFEDEGMPEHEAPITPAERRREAERPREPERSREPERREPPRRTEYDERGDNQGRPDRHYAEARDDAPPRRDDRAPRRDDSPPRREPERPRSGSWGGGQQRGGRGGDNWNDTDRTPTRAKQLFPYACDMDAKNWFKEWGKAKGLSWQFQDWDDRDVQDAVSDYLDAGRPQDAQRNERSNGHAGANGRR